MRSSSPPCPAPSHLNRHCSISLLLRYNSSNQQPRLVAPAILSVRTSTQANSPVSCTNSSNHEQAQASNSKGISSISATGHTSFPSHQKHQPPCTSSSNLLFSAAATLISTTWAVVIVINNSSTGSSWDLLLSHTNLHLKPPRTPSVVSLPSQASPLLLTSYFLFFITCKTWINSHLATFASSGVNWAGPGQPSLHCWPGSSPSKKNEETIGLLVSPTQPNWASLRH